LYPETGELRFPLIQRSSGLYHHANQIGLPGGALEAGESAIEAALRETREELGIDTEAVEILRELSPLGLAVSGFTVYPVAGYTEKVPVFFPNTAEVARCFTVSLTELLQQEALINLNLEDGRQVPAYKLAGEAVWGATAMILSELADLLT